MAGAGVVHDALVTNKTAATTVIETAAAPLDEYDTEAETVDDPDGEGS